MPDIFPGFRELLLRNIVLDEAVATVEASDLRGANLSSRPDILQWWTESLKHTRQVIFTGFLIRLDFWCQLVTKVKSDNEGTLTGLIPRGMRHVAEKTCHSNVEFEIFDGLISALFWRDRTICWMFDEAWMTQKHDIPECNESTVITAFKGH